MSQPEPRPSCDPSAPWGMSPMPPFRSGPPYVMAEAIEREPAVAEAIVAGAARDTARTVAGMLREAAASGWPPAVVGCGTSEHAAMAAAAIWQEAWAAAGLPGPGPVARQAFEAAHDPWPGLTIGISHEGGSQATIDALEAARRRGARTALITAGANSPAARAADVTLCTGELDPSWCHTIAYISPIAAAVAVADALIGGTPAPGAVRAVLEAGRAVGEPAQALGRALAASRTLVVAASGADRAGGRELTLKIEEAAYVATAYRDLETMLHGHIPSLDVGSGLVLILADARDLAARAARARQLLAAVARVGVRSGAILTARADPTIPPALTPAGRVTIPDPAGLEPAAAAVLATAVPLQLTTYALALALGTNPDALRRESSTYRAAAEAADTAQ